MAALMSCDVAVFNRKALMKKWLYDRKSCWLGALPLKQRWGL